MAFLKLGLRIAYTSVAKRLKEKGSVEVFDHTADMDSSVEGGKFAIRLQNAED